MSKFSSRPTPAQFHSAIKTTPQRAYTHEGGIGYTREPKSELFLLAVTNMVSENTFYETKQERDARFASLVQQVTQDDPAWIAGFVPYLRGEMNMRSAAIVMACEYVKAGGPNGRRVIDSACHRADEPAEVLAYWAQTHGRNFPQPVKRGVADAARRLYNERSALRYDGQSRAWRMGDVIEITHAKPKDERQSALFAYLLDERHHPGESGLDMTLPTLLANHVLRDLSLEERPNALSNDALNAAGFSWEDVASWLQGPMDAAAWEAIIPSMGYMALLRNLRNFEQAGVRKEILQSIADKIADPDRVANSRQFPMRFFSAYRHSGTVFFAPALEEALNHSLANVPKLPGKTLVMIDVSGSMHSPLGGQRSQLSRAEAALTFGLALAKAQGDNADVVLYDQQSYVLTGKTSLLRTIEDGLKVGGGGTYTWQAVGAHYREGYHDQVVILTDEQAHPSRHPAAVKCPIYTFNLAGYGVAHNQQGQNGSHAFGGLSDAAFTALRLLSERKGVDKWPWEL